MIYDMRIYTATPGQETALKERFVRVVMPIFERTGIEVVSVFETQEEAPRLIYTTRFENEEERERAWAAFKIDPEWIEAKALSEKNGPLLQKQDVFPLRAVPVENINTSENS